MCMAIFLLKTEKVHQLNTLAKAWVQNMISLLYCNVLEEGFLQKTRDKGRHCCLGDRIYSIPCTPSFFTPG